MITSVSDLKETNTLINIYPNPASDFITFSNEYNEDIDVKIYSISGALIKSETLSKSNYNLEVKHLENEVYIVSSKLKKTINYNRLIIRR